MKHLFETATLKSRYRWLRRQIRRRRVLARPKTREYTGPHGDVLHCCIAYNQYGGYCVPLSILKRPAVQRVLEGNVYEPKTLSFMRDHCSGGDIIHAGTFFGDFLPALAEACRNESIVWAFEPNPESYRCARATLEINGISNVELTHAGLGSKRDSLLLRVRDEQGIAMGGRSRFVDVGPGEETGLVKVPVVRVDDVVPESRNVGILQLDVEGYEEQSLVGALGTIKRCQPILILETEVSQGWFAKQLPEIRYQPIAKLHRNTVFAPQER